MKRFCVGLAMASLLLLGGRAFAAIGTIDNVPAATLLLPYFEVDLSNPEGVNTLFAINNASDAAVLAHITVWSDQSIPVLDFDVYLTGYDVQTLSMRDILVSGNLPRTAPSNTDPSGSAINAGISPRGGLSQDTPYASCAGTLPYTNPALNAAFRAHLQAVLQGNPSPTFGFCYASKTRDNILRGYVTVDTVSRCNVLFPSQLLEGYDAILTNENTLWGDYFYVNSAENFAQGEALVAVESCGGPVDGEPGSQYATCFLAGDHTFYGRYANATAIDNREALPTTMGARYLNGGPFTGGTDFLVWREGGTEASDAGYGCANPGPGEWWPLGATEIIVFDETEQIVTTENCPSGFDCDVDISIPEETQRVDVGDDIPSPFNFGWVYLNLQNLDYGGAAITEYGDPYAQMWLTTAMDAEGRFSVGFEGVAFDNANAPVTCLLPCLP